MERTKIFRNSSFMNPNSSPKERYLSRNKRKKRWDFSNGSNKLSGSVWIIWEINCKTLPVTGRWICPMISAWSSKWKMEKAHEKWVFPVKVSEKRWLPHRGCVLSCMYFNIMRFMLNILAPLLPLTFSICFAPAFNTFSLISGIFCKILSDSTMLPFCVLTQ